MKITTEDLDYLQDRSKMKCEKCRKVFDMIIANPPYPGSVWDKQIPTEQKEAYVHVDVPRVKHGGKKTHPEKSDWNKSKMDDKLGNVLLICGCCRSDLQIERVSVRLPGEEVRRIESWMKTVMPNETLSGVLRLAVKKLIDESSDVEMKIQMAETKIQMMETKIQMMERIIHLPSDDVNRLDMFISDGEGKKIPIEVKTRTKKKRGGRI